jgi:hypothetical protein
MSGEQVIVPQIHPPKTGVTLFLLLSTPYGKDSVPAAFIFGEIAKAV